MVARMLSRGSLALVGALLPDPERRRLMQRHGVDPAPWSLALGVVQLVSGVLLFMSVGLSFTSGQGGAMTMWLLENWDPSLTTEHFRGAGLVGWLFWLSHPLAWLLGALALVGGVRCVAFLATGEAVGEPLVVLGLRLWQALARRFRDRRRERALGPLRPDRVREPARAGELEVVTCREKPEWTERVTIEYAGRFYRVVDVEERPDGSRRALVYRLRENDPAAVIRRLIRYRP